MTPKVSVSRQGPVLMIAINRPDKANAIDADIVAGLSHAYADLSDDPGLRVGLLYGMGAHFTGGLDLASVGPTLAAGGDGLLPEAGRDPWGMYGEPATKPIVAAVQGRCFTAGLELVLNFGYLRCRGGHGLWSAGGKPGHRRAGRSDRALTCAGRLGQRDALSAHR